MGVLPEYRNMLAYIDSKVDGLSFTASQRNLTASALYDVANEHGKAICTLFEKHLDASGFSMIRIQFDTFIRGAWLLHCSTESELKYFHEKDGIKLNFGEMVKAVEHSRDWPEQLSEIKARSWRYLNSYTHGGQFQVSRRFDGKTIQAHHDAVQIDEAVRFSALLTFLGFCEMIEIANSTESDKYPMELYEKVKGWIYDQML